MTRFAFVDAQKASYDVAVLCRLLKVSRSGYYAWVARPPSARAVADDVLTIQIRDAFDTNRKATVRLGSMPSCPMPTSTSVASGWRG